MRHVTATARLQFHHGFTLIDAVQVVPYLAKLGISHVYASPVFTATPGSTHGYDITDVTSINPELGGRAALEQLVAALRAHDMGLVLDIVPNHMASAAPLNRWFTDVLAYGRSSQYAEYFDIDWENEQAELSGKMLLPILGTPYASALESGDLRILPGAGHTRFEIAYFDRRLPLSSQGLEFIRQSLNEHQRKALDQSPLGEDLRTTVADLFDTRSPEGRTRLHELLELQHYRLAFWQNASDEINWRRFFEISDLIGVKVERAKVFDATHALIFELFQAGLIDGIRVDHIDGLAVPKDYCRRLRQRLQELQPLRPEALRALRAPVWVEKILAEGEELALDWSTDGTTGYEFMNDTLRILMDAQGEAPLTQFWVTACADEADFDRYEELAREQILSEHLAGEFERLCSLLTDLSNLRLETRDLTSVVIRRVLFAILVWFRVYRIYSRPREASASDRQILDQVSERCRAVLRPADLPALDIILAWLRGDYEDDKEEPLLRRILARFEQLSAPLAAKSVEDTAFYRYGRLLALNEVGGSPLIFSLSPKQFHARMQVRAAEYPIALSPLATHDHKRGPDTRARLAVLSERPEILAALIRDFVLALEAIPSTSLVRISPVDLLMLLQTVVGAWPLMLDVDDDQGCEALRLRLAGWQQKALREAKVRSNWLLPEEEYEAAAQGTLDLLFSEATLRRTIYDAVQEISVAGALNSLGQVVMQCMGPGVPDIYQGSEMWDFTLVDPDNRRPIAFGVNAAMLDTDTPGTDLLVHWRDGRIKQWLTARLLALRREHAALFSSGDYEPFMIEAPCAERLLGFVRRLGDEVVLVLLPRHCAKHTDEAKLLAARSAFEAQELILPELKPGAPWIEFLTQRSFVAQEKVTLADLFAHLPAVVLVAGQPV